VIYLDNGATSFYKPPAVAAAVCRAMHRYANPGRGGYPAAMEAAREVFYCRELAASMFDCEPEQVVFTSNCTHGLNIAIHTLVKPGARVVISGFEHNAVTRPLYQRNAVVCVVGSQLFQPRQLLQELEQTLKAGVDAAVFTHVSNVFGYILPMEEIAALCRKYQVPLIVDAAQSAGMLTISLKKWDASFIAMPGHKGLLGPQGTGILLCGMLPQPLLAGGTGTASQVQAMPEELPERLEAGTLNVPGISGLAAGMREVRQQGLSRILKKEKAAAAQCAHILQKFDFQVFCGEGQSGTVSFVPPMDCETMAQELARRGIAVRAGLHCAPLAHQSAGTLQTGTVRVSFGHDADFSQNLALEREIRRILKKSNKKIYETPLPS